MEKKYRVKLSVEERQELKAMVTRGRAAAYRQTHARILLLSDEGQGDGVMKDGISPGPSKLAGRRWNGCAAAAWQRVWSGPWGARSN